MKALLVLVSSSSVHQYGKHGIHVGWVVVRTGVKTKVNVCRFRVYLTA
jgi:hypothetical protein